jgi:imidazolonepropionase
MLITNIKGLAQVRKHGIHWVAGQQMSDLPVLENAFLEIKNGLIANYGPMVDCPSTSGRQIIDASGKFVLPGFVDSHTHLVFATSREEEFVDKIKGASYAEIAAKGGGILNSAKKLQKMSEEELFEGTLKRAQEIIGYGTVAVEIKSGYGLTVADELKMLRVARRIGRETPLTVKTTFLGAHAIPKEYTNRQDYIDLVINEMIPAVTEENLADYIDVFCEEGFFSVDETEIIIEQGKKYGLKPKIHANQLNISGGVQVGVKTGAISVDHLESMAQAEIDTLVGSNTMPTLLPGAAFFLNMAYPPARDLIEAGLPVSLATDYNPGSAPCGRMEFMLSLACIKMRMTPEEALNAATLNAAYAMECLDTHGSITTGKAGSVIITKEIPSLAYIPYSFGADLIDQVIIDGELQT